MSRPWERHVHAERVWGTVVTIDLRAPGIDRERAQHACRAVVDELHRIDAWLSPFRTDSAVSGIRTGALWVGDAPEPVREVVAGCATVTRLTRGAFDPWRAPGGFDPCGYVKGWGADRAATILGEHGFGDVCVNAAGDVTCRGQSGPEVDGWRIAIADPRDRRQALTTVLVRDAHLATSGRYEQGDHIVDSSTGLRALRVDSASVLAADGGRADGLATALMVSGPAGLSALVREPVWAYLVVGQQAWTVGQQAAAA